MLTRNQLAFIRAVGRGMFGFGILLPQLIPKLGALGFILIEFGVFIWAIGEE